MSCSTKLNALRKQHAASKKKRYMHLHNYRLMSAVHSSAVTIESINKPRSVHSDPLPPVRKTKDFKQRIDAEDAQLHMTPKEYLKKLGVESKHDFRQWMKLFHPDKGGDSDECARVLEFVKKVFRR